MFGIFVQDASEYAVGTQKKVSGEVIKWNNVSGLEKIDALKYIELLEGEIEELKRQVARKSAAGQNELLEYLKSLEPQNLKVTRICASLFWHSFCVSNMIYGFSSAKFVLNL